jgi:hypothetical protein
MLSGDQNDPAVELATTLRALAVKTKTVGHMHRSLVPSLTKLIRLFTDAGDVVNAKMCHEQRLAIMEAESAKETQDLDMLGLTSGDSHISGPWLKDVGCPFSQRVQLGFRFSLGLVACCESAVLRAV